MKKIFLFLASVLAFAACDPEQEDISMGSSISEAELMSMITVETDKAASGLNGNVIHCNCSTKAPVTVGWHIDDKDYAGYDVYKKVKLGDHKVVLTALCGDGTTIKKEFTLKADEITDPLTKYYIYDGDDFTVSATGDAGETRFSSTEGKHFPTITDDIYDGMKTLIFEIKKVEAGAGIPNWGMPDGPNSIRVMNGWWSSTYDDGVELSEGLWELPITEQIAKECAKKYKDNGGGKDLNLLVTRGSVTFGKVYYEE